MSRNSILSSILFLLTAAQATDNLFVWYNQTDYSGFLPFPRGGHGMVSISKSLYVFGGCDNRMSCYNDLHKYNTESKYWDRMNSTGSIPSPRGGHSIYALGTKIYVFGGATASLYYNDLYEYDALLDHWSLLQPQSKIPVGRYNHGYDIDFEGNLMVIGGFNDRGYLNDVWLYSISANQWLDFQTSGKAPTPRELHTVTVVSFIQSGRLAYVFGGFHTGGASNELFVLDLELMEWKQPQDDGNVPEPREGHTAIRQGEYLFISGGCDFGQQTCYSDLYTLDLMTLWWTKLADLELEPIGKERAAVSTIGPRLYYWGGCERDKTCLQELFYINTGLGCPRNCSGMGECRGNMCICEPGVIRHDCSTAIRCKDSCNYAGYCDSTANCICYPGYQGTLCQYEIPCPRNCTASTNGTCQPNGECLCQPGYTGESCECPCVHGICVGGGCMCYSGWEGAICDSPVDIQELLGQMDSAQDQLAVLQQQLSDLESELQSIEEDATSGIAEVIEALGDEELDYEPEDAPVLLQIETPHLVQEASEKNVQITEVLQTYMTTCPEDCNGNGKCHKGKCNCISGFYGDACDKKHQHVAYGSIIVLALIFVIAVLTLGITSACLYLKHSKKSPDPEEKPLMKALWLENKALSFTPSAPLPAPSHPEVLIKVLKAGICNTDLELIKGYYPYTGIPGHEFIGIVVQGPDFLLNKRVVSEINAHCNNCRMCLKDIRTHCDNRTVLGIINRNGAMAEYLTMPADNLILVPDNVEDRVGVFCEPLAAALQIQEQIQIQSGDKVLVIGDGKLGLLISLTLGLTECELLVIGRHQSKLQILQAQGINTGGADDVQERFYDIVVECTGNQQGIEMAMQALRPRGTLVLKSTYAGKTSVDMSRIVVNEFQLVGSRCGPMQKAMDLLASGKLDVTPLITAEYAIEQGLEAFDMAAVPGSLKVLINF